jgi:hypothetical protein
MRKTWKAVAEATADQLGIKVGTLSAEQKAALALVHAGAELGKHLKHSDHTRKVLYAWARLVDDSLAAVIAGQLIGDAETTVNPEWLGDFAKDSSAAEVLPPQVLALGLLLLPPPERAKTGGAWEYLDEAARRLAVSPTWLEEVSGWLQHSASPEVAARVSAQIGGFASARGPAAAIAALAKAHEAASRNSSAREEFANVFVGARERLRERTVHVLQHADALQIEGSGWKRLLEQIEADHFRLAVLGEFKRGKSTLINTLVAVPELLPADILPCTSAVTELRYGEALAYEVRDPATPGQYDARDQAAFRAGAASAAQRSSRKESAALEAERVERWRVSVPSPFLKAAVIDVIDTPGLGEDYARDFIAKQEAHRADAAILVFDATQLATQQELELVVEMGPKLENLIVAVNRADAVPEKQWQRLREHVLGRLQERGHPIPSERVVFISASQAESALKEQEQGPWRERFEVLRAIVQKHLIANSGQRKAKVLCKAVLKMTKDGKEAIESQLKVRASRLEQIENIEAAAAEAAAMYDAACKDVEIARNELAKYETTAQTLAESFRTALPGIFEEVERERDGWTSKRSLVGSPKAHLEEVAAQAQKSVEKHVAEWVNTKGAEIISAGLTERIESTAKSLDSLKAYLEKTLGLEAEPLVDEMKRRALEDTAEQPLVTPDAEVGGAVVKMAVMGAISLAVGYIVADVVLYYVLGVISGFLNPILLAAAAAVGLAAYLLIGDDAARSWVRGQIFSKICEGLQSEKAQSQLLVGFKKAAREVFTRFARAFKEAAGTMVNEVRFQQKAAEKELSSKKAELGTPEALAKELGRLEKLASETRDALNDLEATANSLLAELRE